MNKRNYLISAMSLLLAFGLSMNANAQMPMGGGMPQAPQGAPRPAAQPGQPGQPGQARPAGTPQGFGGMGMGRGQQQSFTKTDITPYFAPATAKPATPDAEGFIRRWTLLEPIEKANRSNTVFTDSYLRTEFGKQYFQNQQTIIPKDGDVVKVEGKELKWHALDSKLFNVKLFRFATSLADNAPRYGILCWAVTVINCDQDMENVRLAVGSNSASMWWVNGEEAVILSGDRRMVADDATSKRLTLKKGKNVVRGVIINGPGMSDFCVRVIDENCQPVKNITITND